MPKIEIYTTTTCPYCVRAKMLLDSKSLTYTEIDVCNPSMRELMIKRANRHTVPQIFINGNHIGGCDDLISLNNQGELDKLINSTQ